MQDIFLAITAVMEKLVAVPACAAQLACMAGDVKQMEAVAQILLRKVDTESKYLARLEGNTFHIMQPGLSTHVCDIYWQVKHCMRNL